LFSPKLLKRTLSTKSTLMKQKFFTLFFLSIITTIIAYAALVLLIIPEIFERGTIRKVML